MYVQNTTVLVAAVPTSGKLSDIGISEPCQQMLKSDEGAKGGTSGPYEQLQGPSVAGKSSHSTLLTE